MSPMSAEATVVRHYIDWVLDLPWFEQTQDVLDITKAEEIVEDIAANHPDISQKPKVPEVVLRDFGKHEVIMEVRYYVDNAKKMRPSKSFFVTEILRRFEEGGVKLSIPASIQMNADVDLDDLGL
jgi:small-conductance mechanosensitive channel